MVRGNGKAFWLALAAIAGVVAFAPSLIHLPSVSAAMLPVLQSAACIAFLVGIGALVFSAGNAPAKSVEPIPLEPSRDVVPTALLDSIGDQALDTRIQQSVQASLSYSRTVGVVYINLGCYGHVTALNGVETADRAMMEIAALLRSNVRAYDYVIRLDKDEIVVCLSQLREKSELLAVAERLTSFVQQIRVSGLPDAIEPAVGHAIYPMCGYTGIELVDFARAASRKERARLHVQSVPVTPAPLPRVAAARAVPQPSAGADARPDARGEAQQPVPALRTVTPPVKRLRRRTKLRVVEKDTSPV